MVTRQQVFNHVAQDYIKDHKATYESHIDMLLDSLSGNETEFGEPFSWEKRREILKEEINRFSEALSRWSLISANKRIRYNDSLWSIRNKVASENNIPV